MRFSGRARARSEAVDITARVRDAVAASGVEEGWCRVYVPHTTAGVAINEAADPVHRASLIALGLVLFVLTFVVLALSRMLIARLARGEGSRT